jgi:hypothetical protein
MEASAVRRLICVTGFGAGDSRGRGGLFYNAALCLILRRIYADKDAQEWIIRHRDVSLIEINLVDPFLCRGFRFKGCTEVYESGPEFDFVAEALWSREGQYPVNAVVKVTVEQASTTSTLRA